MMKSFPLTIHFYKVCPPANLYQKRKELGIKEYVKELRVLSTALCENKEEINPINFQKLGGELYVSNVPLISKEIQRSWIVYDEFDTIRNDFYLRDGDFIFIDLYYGWPVIMQLFLLKINEASAGFPDGLLKIAPTVNQEIQQTIEKEIIASSELFKVISELVRNDLLVAKIYFE